MKPLHFYVHIGDADLARLQRQVASRFRHYGRIQLFRVDCNAVIKAASLCLQASDSLNPEVKEELISYVHGFIEGANLESSTSDLPLN